MRYVLCLAAVLLACSVLADDSACPIPSKRVAIMDLKVSGDYSEQVKEWLPPLIEDQLLKCGWTLVVRGERMDHIQQERALPGVRPDTKVPDNELIGATAFIELSARVQVKDIQGIIGYKAFTVGDYARATVDVNGQIVDPATGLLKSSVTVGGSAGGLKTALAVTVGSNWRIGAAGYNLQGVRETLVGKAADQAASRLIDKLKALYPAIPGQSVPASMQLSSTTVQVEPQPDPTILMDLSGAATPKIGDRYGIYREGQLVAEVELIRLTGKRGEARIVTQSSAIQSTDTARLMPVVIKAQ